MTDPTLTVVIAAYNAAETLEAQLAALRVQQWSGCWEVVVVDNGSTDATRAIAERAARPSWNVRVIDAFDRRGPAYARNVGAADARGKSVVFCDADDVVGFGWVAAMGTALESGVFVCGPIDLEALNPDWLRRSRGTTGTTGVARFDDRFPFASSCNLGIDRELFLAVGGFDEELLVGEDIDLSMRLFLRGVSLEFVESAVVSYRLRPSLRATFRQAVSYGAARPVLAERWRTRGGGAVIERGRGLRNWGWLVRHVPRLRTRAGRAAWLWVAGQRIGSLRGSVAVRRLYL